MKKHFLVCLFAALSLGSVVTSCSDDDDPIVCPIETTTFNSLNGLELTYSGETLLGKQVIFTPNATDGTKATLTLSGVGFTVEGMPVSLPGTGIIPGEETTVLNVENMVINGDAVSFEGNDENEGRIINYKGTASKSNLKLDLNVTMPSNVFAGKTFNLVPMTEKPTSLYFSWKAEEFDFSGGKWDIQSAILMTLGMFPVTDGMTALDALSAVLKDVTFMEDGNIKATYKDEPKDENWQESPLNLASYLVKDNKIKLFLNPEQIAFIASRSSRVSIVELVPSLLQKVNELLVNGITLTFAENEGATAIYLDKEELMPILQMVKPLLQDKDTVNALVKMLAESAGPQYAGLVMVFVPEILKNIPNVIDTTTELKIGINVIEAK